MTISLIIPTYRRFDCLADTLNSLAKCDTLPDEIIISDQNIGDLFDQINEQISKLKAIKNLSKIRWKHIYCDKIGISVARNVGLDNASGEIVVFTDDDVLFPKDFFKNVMRCMDNKKIAMVGGVDYKTFPNSKPNIIKRLALTATGLNGTIRTRGSVSFGIFGKYPANFEIAIPTEWAMGYCMVFRKALLKEANLRFDEKLTKYSYGEDLELTHLFYRWCRTNDFLCILSPDIGVQHMVSKENRQMKEQAFFQVFVNRQYINSIFHGCSIVSRFLLFYSNIFYVFSNTLHGDGHEVRKAFKRFLPLRKALNFGIFPPGY